MTLFNWPNPEPYTEPYKPKTLTCTRCVDVHYRDGTKFTCEAFQSKAEQQDLFGAMRYFNSSSRLDIVHYDDTSIFFNERSTGNMFRVFKHSVKYLVLGPVVVESLK